MANLKKTIRLLRVMRKMAERNHRVPATRKYATSISIEAIEIAKKNGLLYDLVTRKF